MANLMERNRKWFELIYALISGFLLLGYLYVIAVYKDWTISRETFQFPTLFWILRIISGVLAIWLGKLWKNKGFWLLAAYLLLKTVRVAIPNPQNLLNEGVAESLLTGFWVFTACFGLASVLSPEKIKRFFGACGAVWTIGMVIYSGIGLYAAWKNILVYNIGAGSAWGIIEGRLWLNYYMTVSGSVLSISVVIALCCAVGFQKRAAKILFILAAIPMLAALALTDSRSAQISVGAGIAVLCGICLIQRFQRQGESKRDGARGKIIWYQWLMIAGAMAGIFVGTVFTLTEFITLFNRMTSGTISLIPRALAEEAQNAAPAIINRGFSGNNVLNYRPEIWKTTFTYLKDNPILLLTGTSILDPMTGVNAILPLSYSVSHCHNMPIMVLLENGIPGLIIIGAFFVLYAMKAWKTLRGEGETWKKATIAIVCSVMVGELVECFTWLRSGQAPVLPFFFVMIGLLMVREDEQ